MDIKDYGDDLREELQDISGSAYGESLPNS